MENTLSTEPVIETFFRTCSEDLRNLSKTLPDCPSEISCEIFSDFLDEEISYMYYLDINAWNKLQRLI